MAPDSPAQQVLERAFADLTGAQSWEDAAAVVERNPRLLDPDAQQLIADAAQAGPSDDFARALIDDLLERLRECHESGSLGPLRPATTLPWTAVAERFLSKFETAQELFEQFRREGEPSRLGASLAAWRSIHDDLDFASTATEFQLVVLDGLETCLLMRHYLFGDEETLERAIDYGRRALARTDPDARFRARRLTNLAGALSARFQAHREPADIGEAVELAREALERTPEAVPEWPGRVSSLGVALSTRYESRGTLADLDEAIELLGHAVAVAPSGLIVLPQLLHNLGAAQRARYHRDRDPGTLDGAIDAFRRAVSTAPEGAPNRVMYRGELGRTLLLRHADLGDEADLDRAIGELRTAIEEAPPGYANLGELATGLGLALRDRFERSQDDADLDDALASFRNAFLAIPLSAPQAGQYAANLRATLEQASERLSRAPAPGATSRERAAKDARQGFLQLELHSLTGDDRYVTEAVDSFRAAADATPPADPEHVERSVNLALALRARAVRLGSPADLDEAVTLTERLLASAEPDGGTRWLLNANLGVLLVDRARARDSKADRTRAIEAFEEALRTVPAGSPRFGEVAASLMAALRSSFEETGDLALVDRAISVGRKTLEAGRTPGPDLAAETAEALLMRAQLAPGAADVEEAIQVCWTAVEEGAANSPEYARCFNALGGALRARFDRIGDQADVSQAIAAYQHALALRPDDPAYLSNVGAALRARAFATGSDEDLDAAIEHLRAAVEKTEPGSASVPVHYSNLAGGLQTRFDRTENAEDLDGAVDALRGAVAAAPRGSPFWSAGSCNLAEALLKRFDHGGSEGDYEEALRVLRDSSAASPTTAAAPLISYALGSALQRRLAPDAPHADVEAVRRHYRVACETGVDQRLEACLASSSAWGNWALERRAWDEAAEAYGHGLEAIEQGIRAQLGRADVETWLRKAQRLPGSAAFALAHACRVSEAVEAIERGRARLLSSALELDRRDLEQLPALGYADLYRRFRNAAARAANGGDGGGRGTSLADQREKRASVAAARQALDAIVDEIRGVPGFADFLGALDFDQVVEASRDAPLVYLVATAVGGMALVISAGNEPAVTHVPLDGLTSEALGENVVPYLDAYVRFRRDPGDPAAWQTWSDALYATTEWLGETVMSRLGEAFGTPVEAQGGESAEPIEVVLVPSGPLGLLPFAAAWVSRPNGAVARWYAVDTFRIRYAPNARALLAASELAKQAGPDRLVLAFDPQPVSAEELPHVHAEAAAIAGVWSAGSATFLPGEAVTRTALTTALADHTVLHFAGHAFADMRVPIKSGLLLGSDELLSVGDLTEQRLRLRLAILSACETGVPGVELPEEVVGLPTALVQAGTAAVIASLWPVADDSTALLMGAFHRNWRIGKLPPAEALRRAQSDLRDGGYEHLHYWAPFTYTGAP